MANGLQRAIYNLANTVPLAVMTALVWYLEFESWCVSAILLSVAMTVTILFAFCFRYGKGNCSTININVSKIISKDSWLVAYVIAYMFPFAYMVIDDFNIATFIILGLMLVLIFIPAIMALPNILLFCVGYHFYEIETENTGVGDYLLISKRKRIRNKVDVRTVMRIFEKLLLDTNGDE